MTAPWNSPETVGRFAVSPGNDILLRFAEKDLKRSPGNDLLDIGCGAGSNAVPLARQGWQVTGIDLSKPMLETAANRIRANGLADRVQLAHAAMDRLPAADHSQDFIVAHGIWNLAGSSAEFRAALNEAARVARPGAALFVYLFSRSTFPPDTDPVPGESFVFTQFSGRPQCFLTEQQLIDELGAAGFEQEHGTTITEYARPETGSKPAIFEAIFRRC
jgi:ubiquinone/menaquinone biosynthesis C-methylase UbiE